MTAAALHMNTGQDTVHTARLAAGKTAFPAPVSPCVKNAKSLGCYAIYP